MTKAIGLFDVEHTMKFECPSLDLNDRKSSKSLAIHILKAIFSKDFRHLAGNAQLRSS